MKCLASSKFYTHLTRISALIIWLSLLTLFSLKSLRAATEAVTLSPVDFNFCRQAMASASRVTLPPELEKVQPWQEKEYIEFFQQNNLQIMKYLKKQHFEYGVELEDIMQEGRLKVYNKWNQFSNINNSNRLTWAISTFRNTLLTFNRNTRARERHLDRQDRSFKDGKIKTALDAAEETAGLEALRNFSFSDQLEANQRLDSWMRAIDSMPTVLKEVLIIRLFGAAEFSQEPSALTLLHTQGITKKDIPSVLEISQILKISLSAAKTRLYRANHLLQKYMRASESFRPQEN